MSQEVNIEIKKQTGIITLNTADGLNAINRKILSELAEAAVSLDMNNAVKVIIIRGNDKAFSSGLDVNDFLADTGSDAIDEMYENFEKIADVKKTVIAAVSGYALGIGCELVLACDIVLASESACFGHPDLSLGIVPGFGATQRMPYAVGKAKTMEMILTGRAMSAEEASLCGLISRVVCQQDLFAEALRVAMRIASLPYQAVMQAKETIKQTENTNLQNGMDLESKSCRLSMNTPEFKEILGQFLQKI